MVGAFKSGKRLISGSSLNVSTMKTLGFLLALLSTTAIFGNIAVDERATRLEKVEEFVDKVPQSVLDEFVNSFVYEDGYFRGARVDMLWPYLSDEEILRLVESYINYPTEYSVHVWERQKPKPRGCKVNPRWTCIIGNVDVVHQ